MQLDLLKGLDGNSLIFNPIDHNLFEIGVHKVFFLNDVKSVLHFYFHGVEGFISKLVPADNFMELSVITPTEDIMDEFHGFAIGALFLGEAVHVELSYFRKTWRTKDNILLCLK